MLLVSRTQLFSPLILLSCANERHLSIFRMAAVSDHAVVVFIYGYYYYYVFINAENGIGTTYFMNEW